MPVLQKCFGKHFPSILYTFLLFGPPIQQISEAISCTASVFGVNCSDDILWDFKCSCKVTPVVSNGC